MKQKNFWSACEMLVGPAAVEFDWKQLAGEDYEGAKVFLRPMQELATRYPCMRSYTCGCDHRVVIHSEDDIVGVCTCNPQACETFRLTKSDIIIYELDRTMLHRTIVEALSLEPAEAEIPNVRWTTQIGYYSPRSGVNCPVFLTIQTEPENYRSVISLLAARNSEPFIVVVPTTSLFPPDVLDTLSLKNAALLTLSDMLVVNASGKMAASPSCNGMLARFSSRALGVSRAGLLSLNDVFFYSPDFHCVLINDFEFTLTSTQSQVIQILCEAYRNGTPDVGKDYIMEEIGSLCDRRLRDVFCRDQEAFKCLIRPGKRRGTYRLNI